MSESLIGIIIGAAAAILGGFLGEMLKYHLDIKRENRAAIRSIYENIEENLYKVYNHAGSTHPDEFRHCFDMIGGKIVLYCRQSIVDLWGEIIEILCKPKRDINDNEQLRIKCGKLLKLMRADLNLHVKD